MLRICLAGTLAASVVGLAFAHTDDPKVNDRFGPYRGTGWQRSSGEEIRGLYDSYGDITLQSWLSLEDLGGADTRND